MAVVGTNAGPLCAFVVAVVVLTPIRLPTTAPPCAVVRVIRVLYSRVCGNTHGLIRKYGLNMCRQCFKDYAKDIGFVKVRQRVVCACVAVSRLLFTATAPSARVALCVTCVVQLS